MNTQGGPTGPPFHYIYVEEAGRPSAAVGRVPVGADAFIGPFRIRRKEEKTAAFHRRGDEGIAPYDKKDPS